MKNSLILLSVFLLFATACRPDNPLDPKGKYKEDPGSATPVNSNIKLTATIDGTVYTAELLAAIQATFSNGINTISQYTVKGESEDGESFFQFVLQGENGGQKFQEGSYDLASLGAQGISFTILWKLQGGESMTINPGTNKGQLVLSTVNETSTKGTIDGEFLTVGMNPQTFKITCSFETDNYRHGI